MMSRRSSSFSIVLFVLSSSFCRLATALGVRGTTEQQACNIPHFLMNSGRDNDTNASHARVSSGTPAYPTISSGYTFYNAIDVIGEVDAKEFQLPDGISQQDLFQTHLYSWGADMTLLIYRATATATATPLTTLSTMLAFVNYTRLHWVLLITNTKIAVLGSASLMCQSMVHSF